MAFPADINAFAVLTYHRIYIFITVVFTAFPTAGIAATLHTAGADIFTASKFPYAVIMAVTATVLTAGIEPAQAVLTDKAWPSIPSVSFNPFAANLTAAIAAAYTFFTGFLFPAAIQILTGFLPAADTQPCSTYCQRPVVMPMVCPDADLPVEFRMCPVRISPKAPSCLNAALMPATVWVCLPQVRLPFQHGNLTLDQVAVKLGIALRPVRAAGSVIHPALQKQPIAGLIRKNLACSLSVIQQLRVVRVVNSEGNKAYIVPCISGTAIVLLVIR